MSIKTSLGRVTRKVSPRLLPGEVRRQIVARFPRVPLAAASFQEAGRRKDAAFFEAFYSAPDPYAAMTRELAKYTVLLSACGVGPFDSALELGCSVGVFTAMLAPRCLRLLAIDIAENALAQARVNAARFPHVHFERRSLPEEMPPGQFELIVASDILYYWGRRDLHAFATKLRGMLSPGGRFVCLSWLGPVQAVGSGAEVSTFLRGELPLRHVSGQQVGESILDIFEN
jgi:cyclopropane fatty-acyl-phospholipid synthase-like methyltransferase